LVATTGGDYRMKRPVRGLLFWTPRILCMLFAGFLSIFAADVFGEHYGFWKTILALLIHLIPTWILLIMLAISWRWERLGGILFIGLGVFYMVTTWGRFDGEAYLLIGGPPILIGVLFLLNWRCRREPGGAI
jgi:hypothetical protein